VKKVLLILIFLLISSQIFGQTSSRKNKPQPGNEAIQQNPQISYEQKESSKEEFRVFTGLFIPIIQWNNGDFNGDSFFITEEGGRLAIPKLDTGIGWGVTAGWSIIYQGQNLNFVVKPSFSISQSFHNGKFEGDTMDASFLMFTWYFSGGIQLFDRITLLAGCGWDIPYFLFIQDGYIEGTEHSDLTYWDFQGLDGGIGLDIK